MPERAKELANLIGGHALTLADLENYHPEDGMILANTTSMGMQPHVNDTPLSKVFFLVLHLLVCQDFVLKLESNMVLPQILLFLFSGKKIPILLL
jgi:shikimate 5-dehydrogenase